MKPCTSTSFPVSRKAWRRAAYFWTLASAATEHASEPLSNGTAIVTLFPSTTVMSGRSLGVGSPGTCWLTNTSPCLMALTRRCWIWSWRRLIGTMFGRQWFRTWGRVSCWGHLLHLPLVFCDHLFAAALVGSKFSLARWMKRQSQKRIKLPVVCQEDPLANASWS